VSVVLDLTSELSAPAPFRGLTYLNLPILDLTAPLDAHFEEAVTFIDRHCQAQNGIVYVHCKAGYSRSAAVVAAYLLRTRLASSAEDAVSLLRAARPGIIIRPEALEAIRSFGARAVR
jgi:protein-tyrosine phosphatase